jgi:hypothetical protein
MAVYKQPKSKYWWYKFTWNGEPIRESTKQTNKRVAEQMEAAHLSPGSRGGKVLASHFGVPANHQLPRRNAYGSTAGTRKDLTG